MKLSVIIGGLVLLVAGETVPAATLDFPDLGLASSPNEVRAWARQHKFTAQHGAEPGQETYQRSVTNTQMEKLSFIAGSKGLQMLQFEQSGVLETAPLLRRKVYQRFGKPDKDQIINGGALRLIYPYKYNEPARRVFILQPHGLAMFLMTEAFVTGQQNSQARAEQVQRQERQAQAVTARNAWLVPILWAGGIILGLAVFIKVMPRAISDPVRKLLGGMIGIIQDTLSFVFYQATGFVLYGMFLISGLAVGSGALEWGTSWWWALPVLFGFVTMVKGDTGEFIKWSYVAIVFYVIATVGVFAEKGVIHI